MRKKEVFKTESLDDRGDKKVTVLRFGEVTVGGKTMNSALNLLSLKHAGGQELTRNRNPRLSRKFSFCNELNEAGAFYPWTYSARCLSLNVYLDFFLRSIL